MTKYEKLRVCLVAIQILIGLYAVNHVNSHLTIKQTTCR